MSVANLSKAIKSTVEKRIEKEGRVQRGIVNNGRVQIGSKSYPMKQAVDCNASNGRKVWAQLSKSGDAVVVGT